MRTAFMAGLAALAASGAQAQVYYGGYNLGPDYGAMIAQAQAQQAAQNAQMQQMTASIVQQNMRNPQVQAAWNQHRAQGGGMSLEQFAYQWAATGGFSPQGMAYYQQNEAANRAKEMAALQGVRQAEAARGQAQRNLQEGYARNQAEAGRNLQGRRTYADPATGGQVALQYLQPGQPSYDPGSGRTYVMDGNGTYWSAGPDGYWTPMPR